MYITYDILTKAFLMKINEFDLLNLMNEEKNDIVRGYMDRAISQFKKICKYDLSERNNKELRLETDFEDSDVDEIVDIISEGMVVQWLKPFVYSQELLENALNTSDFSTYSPAELLLRIGNAYKKAQKDYTQMVREYSYNHGDLTGLHM